MWALLWLAKDYSVLPLPDPHQNVCRLGGSNRMNEQALWRLPRDVFGNLVLRFLNLRDLVQLDQSCCSHQRRISYLEALRCLRTQLKAKEDITLAAVNWAVLRGVKCAHVLVRNSSFGLEQLLTCRPKVMCTVQQNTLSGPWERVASICVRSQ
jgi:hypothetical protein